MNATPEEPERSYLFPPARLLYMLLSYFSPSFRVAVSGLDNVAEHEKYIAILSRKRNDSGEISSCLLSD
jgi:hypothetical protein